MIGIYQIRNKLNGKLYIGQSTNVEKRFKYHLDKLRRGTHTNLKLQRSWDLHGETEFELSIIQECQVEELDYLERSYIASFDTVSSGYNLEEGGNKNKKLTEEHKRKIALSNTGKHPTPETLEKLKKARALQIRPPMTEERKQLQREFMTGKKMRLGKKGQKFSEEAKKRMSTSMMGNTNSKGKKRTEEEKQHLREIWTGTKRPFKGHTTQYYINHPDKVPK